MTKRAILIAVEYLPPSQNEKNLDDDSEDEDDSWLFKGCINDVVAINSHLLVACGFQQENIQTLISYPPTHEGLQVEAKLPTYTNLLESFDLMHKEGNEGDIFYFHFSGPVCAVFQKYVSGYPEKHKALRVLDDNEQRSYIYNSELVFLFKRLAEKGIDCCVTLDSRESRDIEASSNFRGLRLSNCQLAEMLNHFSLQQNLENNRLQRQHSPLSHTVLSLKFGRNRSAQSVYEVSSKKHYGFLTFFLLMVLRRSASPLTWDEIVWQIGLQRGDSYPITRCSGATDRLFLCGQIEQTTYSSLRFSGALNALDKRPTKLIIEGGAVHGLSQGAMGFFTPLRREMRDKGINGQTSLQFRIVTVNQLFSQAEVNDLFDTINMSK
ncbi:hypothetical protein N7513_011829 [Penicillium frequentans]|nr:hypothetical protein N7513_011829 [Penicillium glabrum]